MASTYTGLGVQLMTTGEKAGTWGTLTNTNWNIIEQISGGYVEQDIAGGAQTTTLSVSDGTAGATLAHRVVKFTGAITGNQIVTIPLDVQTFYFIDNGTTGAYTVQFKYVSGSGGTVTWGTTDKGNKIIYAAADDATNPNIIDFGMGDVTLTGTETLTNKTLTAPKFADGGFIADTTGAETLVFGEVSSPLNEVKITNAATGTAGPIIASQGESNSNLQLRPAGTGMITTGTAAAHSTISSNGAYNLILETNEGTNSGTITITDAANGDINIAPNGTGEVQAGGSVVNNAGTQTMFIPAQAMFGTTTNGADAQAVETTAVRPELKVLDFDASTAEYAQFSVAMPKSWNLGTVTYQVFWSPSNTNTDNCIFGLQGVSCTEGDTADVVFGTAVEVTDAGIGTVEDVQMTAVSGAMTIAGSPADDDYTFFQLYRDAADGSDTFTGDARVLGIKLFYTTDAANDA
jgi:hypothetical protein